jgi:hypothetical protein
MTDGRQRALSALAYQAGDLLDWSGLAREHVARQFADAGTVAGLRPSLSARIVHRAIAADLPPFLTDDHGFLTLARWLAR